MTDVLAPPAAAPPIQRRWIVIPLVSLVVSVISLAFGATLVALPGLSALWPTLEFIVLMAAVFAAVQHAEAIAHALGEPYGTLVLTMSVTVIECALILSIMLGGDGNPTLARDTTMAVVMIILNLIIGLSIILGGLKYGEQGFRVNGARSYLIVLLPLCILTMVLPNHTSSSAGPYYSSAQIVFISMVTLALYVMFLYVQTVRHREFFVPEEEENDHAGEGLTPRRLLMIRFVLLSTALVGIVLLSKSFSKTIGKAVAAVGAPESVIGIVVALLVLLPESLAAIAAVRRDRMQTAINLALGSSLATIGLTIPAVGLLSIWLDMKLAFGLDGHHVVLLILSLATAMLTFGVGRTNILPGFVHLMLMAVFVFLTFVP